MLPCLSCFWLLVRVAVLPNTAWMPFPASKDIKTAAGQQAQVGGVSAGALTRAHGATGSDRGARLPPHTVRLTGFQHAGSAAGLDLNSCHKFRVVYARAQEPADKVGCCLCGCCRRCAAVRSRSTPGCVTHPASISWHPSRAGTHLWHPMPRYAKPCHAPCPAQAAPGPIEPCRSSCAGMCLSRSSCGGMC